MADTASEAEDRLESRLLRAALKELADAPVEQLSMRHVAQSLGVSHQAPYVHFGSRKRFLAAVAGTGLAEATARARAAVEAAGDRPPARLHALADAYLDFIREHPHVHDLAHGPTVAKADHPLLQRAAIQYWDLLHDTIASCQPQGTSEAEVLCRAAVAWSTVYGISRLSAFGQLPDSVPASAGELIHGAIDQLLAGWQHGMTDPSQRS
ncbi:TetR/AcrR family transcriptional regulator [Humibacillus xanthopallidus]|uniref:TetR family transcriptional regulator n=1 Tax=Humibacillus xanthopallidus TaxID=412689 RepID=A0A543HI37_9MICO|nr:TetR/AcrR family transcriptional regulator [Humibacillus xanthopallidus]TQM57984.1 TetR family transcriptional regulator [Humibacillus xanthopallidus]